ncbi:MAG: RecQ family ATP-dependent DNA helicase, partial [Dehalococcoidia bacterium]
SWNRAVPPPQYGPNWPVDVRVDYDEGLQFDSYEERRFFFELLPAMSRMATAWTLPQAALDSLAISEGAPQGSRRIDFLVCRPGFSPLAIEIDGLQHDNSTGVDEERVRQLRAAGIDTIRIPAAEVRGGAGPNLSRLGELLSISTLSALTADERLLVHGPAQVHRFALGLCELFQAGHFLGKSLFVQVDDDLGIPLEAFTPYIRMLGAVNVLWGTDELVPGQVAVSNGGETEVYSWGEDGFTRAPDLDTMTWPRVSLRLESHRTPVHVLPTTDERIVVVRPAVLPVRPSDPLIEGGARPLLTGEGVRVQRALEVILEGVFGKSGFREGQSEGIVEILAGRDCTVLLPTGAGKSLIYQLAGLVMPGRTLVIDPLISLIEDQVEGLSRIGIDRTAVFSSYQTQQGLGADALQATASGEALFIFLAPERLQQSAFREAVRTLAYSSTVNLAVVDEAHCVSEWGHDFRTAYLRLGRVLRDVCRDARGAPPPILALTGTASRAVLRDVLLELGIERRSENSVVRPDTFDRPELRFSVVRVPPSEAIPSLIGLLRTLPGQLGISASDAFRVRNLDTASGIVFVPWVNGEHGVVEVAAKIASAIGVSTALYSGSAPRTVQGGDWEETKRRHATAFKENQVPVLVSTKAFGMGIDKPNVRYVVHYGLPSSIEAFYQEAGRAGRDRRAAECAIVLIEQDDRRDRELLEERTPLERSRQQYESIGRSEQDDVTRQLFFHFNSFEGVQAELKSVRDVAGLLGDLAQRRKVEIPFGSGDARSSREKALHRLVVLGVVRDYLVEWGSRKFVVELEGASPISVTDALVEYVTQYNRFRGAIEAEEAAGLRDHSLDIAVVEAAERLIRFTYDTIELSRRRSLREVWLAARDSASDSGDVLRARVLKHLTEGDLSPALVALVDAPDLDLGKWLSIVEQAGDDVEAGEIRGSAARLLESYPDHPGLLFARSWSEFLDSGGDLQELSSNLTAALDSARTSYAIPMSALSEFVGSLLVATGGRAETTAVVASAIEARIESTIVDGLLEKAIDGEGSAGLKVLALRRRLERSFELIEAVTR